MSIAGNGDYQAGDSPAGVQTGVAFSVPGACRWCSGPFSVVTHSGPCPRVKAIEYHPDGAVKRVEFNHA